ncbi:MAG: HAMP domain-containing histidine kinase [Fibrobacteria bacterium]|nr:HAMP domain-containing histidine kinase [Fibrobacteria bacterium]
MKKPDTDKSVYGYLYHEAAIIMLQLDKDGTVLDANKFLLDFIGKDNLTPNQKFHDLLVDFGNLPSFSELVQGGQSARLLNVTSHRGLPQSFYFTFYEEDGYVLAFGQLDQLEIEAVRNNLVDANAEINNLARDLQKKNAELEQLNKLKNQFLGIAAHDLRNPLGIILNYSMFVADQAKEVLNEKQVKFLKRIKDSSYYMLKLVNDFLDVSKIESGKLELQLEPCNMHALIEQNVSLNQVFAEEKQIKLVFKSKQHIQEVMADNSKIEQVLNNLISNALKYSFPDTTVEVAITRQENKMVISVQDEGQGIPESELAKLFKPFQTTSVKSTAKEKSTGLGLLICKNIVKGHQGTIWVESEEGKGSKFCFSLPLAEPDNLQKNQIHDMVTPDKHQTVQNIPEENMEKSSPPLSSGILDLEEIKKYQSIGIDFLHNLIDMYMQESPLLINDIKDASEKGDYEKMHSTTQLLNSTSVKLGAVQLGFHCDNILKLDVQKNQQFIQESIVKLESLFLETKKALLAVKNSKD